ncbi:glycosyltransferase family protein [Amycolatopsis cihanbeyliensis]|uniref:Glycosyl transferase family 1 n=1 Tax=Amycolatopsis cihanbeyliensis TaxID=1128664 RepID=A0A542DLQ8_AMYCI|nr:glycosyltransferase [Amycolatopsis cihanbeyliensis]TQJ04027.1 glycosyl transferase family 1 [Amycolatopsis cihanbeyliensis]
MGPAEICFVAGRGGSVFMDEILDVVADAVRRVGGRTRTAIGRFPEPGPDTVYLVVPHEYFIVTPQAELPGPELLARTIGFCVEHPGTLSFERTAQWVPRLACGVDINLDSTAELRRRGNPVEHFQLGYSPLWDHWGGDPDRPRSVDVTYLGTEEARRSRLLGSYWRELESLRTRILTPPHEMMGPPRVDFLPGAAKFAHLADSRMLLNLHRGRSVALEWVRVLEALCNGCVVLTEPSPDIEPLVPGEHLMVARAEALGAVASALAGQPERERELRQAGYEFVRTKLDLPASATMLVETATRLVGGSFDGVQVAGPAAEVGTRLAGGSRQPAESISVSTPSWDVRFSPGPTGPQDPGDPAACAMAVERTRYARRAARRGWQAGRHADLFGEAPRADVDVLVVRRPGEPDPAELVHDLLSGSLLPRRVLLGEDGSASRSTTRPHDTLVHEFPLGRGVTRNTLLRRSGAPRTLVLDAGMRAAKHLLERLLEGGPEQGVAHCPVADPVAGLVGALPAEQRRLDRLPYLGSGYLVHRSVLDAVGGWTEDPLLDGLEDHVFWRRVVAGGQRSTLVQQVLLHRMRPDPAPRPVDLDPRKVWAAANAPGA